MNSKLVDTKCCYDLLNLQEIMRNNVQLLSLHKDILCQSQYLE